MSNNEKRITSLEKKLENELLLLGRRMEEIENRQRVTVDRVDRLDESMRKLQKDLLELSAALEEVENRVERSGR
jgi:peptidoglycan hydrolase CwlO-like protein